MRCRKCDEAAGDSMPKRTQTARWTIWKFNDDTDDVWFDQVGDAGGIIVHVVPRPSGSEALVAECIGDAVKEYSKA